MSKKLTDFEYNHMVFMLHNGSYIKDAFGSTGVGVFRKLVENYQAASLDAELDRAAHVGVGFPDEAPATQRSR